MRRIASDVEGAGLDGQKSAYEERYQEADNERSDDDRPSARPDSGPKSVCHVLTFSEGARRRR